MISKFKNKNEAKSWQKIKNSQPQLKKSVYFSDMLDS